jgi:hypothetical protein
MHFRSRDSSVGILMGYGLDDRGFNPGRGKVFIFCTTSRPDVGPTQFSVKWVPWTASPGVIRPWHEADNSLLSNTEVKRGGAITSLPHASSWRSA